MSQNLPNYQDGYPSPDQETTVVPSIRYPFGDNPVLADKFSKLYDRQYNIFPILYQPRMPNRTSWTNLLTYSERFDNVAWTATNLTVTAALATPLAPDGQASLNKGLETVTNGEHSVAQAATTLAAASEASVFAQGGLGRTFIRLAFTDSATTVFSAFFDIASGSVGALSAGVFAKVVSMGNSQFQCVIQFTPAAGAGTLKVNIASSSSTISYAGDVTKGCYLWGAQVATGTNPPYVSTTSTTRAVSAPDREVAININAKEPDPLAYLLAERDPINLVSRQGTVSRVFGRVPSPQTNPGSLWVTKPAIPGTFPQVLGSSLVMQPDSTVASYQFFTRKLVTYETGSAAGSYPTGGTYTVTVGASTTGAIAFNAVAATLQTALNALTSISDRGTVTVTGDYQLGFVVSFATYAAMTCDTSSLLPSATPIKQIVATTMGGGFQQQFLTLALTSGPPWSGAAITGGTITLTFFGQTTAALAYNASLATYTSAITGLTKVGATGTTVTIPSGSPPGSWGPTPLRSDARVLQLFVTLTAPVISINGGSLTPTGSAGTAVIGTTGTLYYTLKFTGVAGTARSLTASAHGILATDTIYLKLGSTYYTLLPGTFDVPDANTITLGPSSGLLFTTGTITEVGKLASTYTAGAVLSRCNRISTFYFPGVTSGITTSADIPLPVLQADPASLVAAILAGATSINYEVGELAQWDKTPILFRVITTISAAGL